MIAAILLPYSLSAVVAVARLPAQTRNLSMVAIPPILRLRGGSIRESITSAAQLLCSDRGLLAYAEPQKLRISQHMRGVVFGGMDGILTTFALLAAVAGSRHLSTSLTLVIGISTVLADALSMAAGEYLSAKAEQEMEVSDARASSAPGPIEKGAAMFIAFTLFGSMPLLGFSGAVVISHRLGLAASTFEYFSMTVLITGVTLFVLGAIKSTFGSGNWLGSGLEVSAIGGAAAFVAYFSAQVVGNLVGS
mmetsp:Transcript_56771/g.93943  ORF Transcript_56771/g.93943 Transcript_56771/m.93943 type:complete len:249 (+) Transcript_56771:44-790(+)